ncbi:MAG: hypothetical protein V3V99_05610 [candidate division Zixibacteria bacterium]
MVRPIDLQDNLAKTQAAERMNQIQKSHGEMGQRQVADALKEQAAAEMERTRETQETDMVIIRGDKEKEKKEKKRDKKKNDETAENDKEQSGHLDLTG